MKTSFRIVVPCALVLGLAAGAAQAQQFPVDREVWTESTKGQVWTNAYGQCWQSAYGPPPPPGICGIPVAQAVIPAPRAVVVAPPVQQPPRPAPAPAYVAPPPPPPAPAPYVAPVAPRRDRG